MKAGPLHALIRGTRKKDNSAPLQWTDLAEQSFKALKHYLQTALALENLDYSQPFYLYIAENQAIHVHVLLEKGSQIRVVRY